MSDRLLKALAGILAFLVLAWAVAQLLSRRSGEAGSAPFALSELAELEIDSVIVTGGEDTVRLRAGDRWMVNGHEAMAGTGEQLKEALESARVGTLASRNPENHDRLGVTEDAGRRLTIFAGGDPRLELVIGDRAGAFDEAYARRVAEPEVYTLSGSLVNLANRGVSDWRDKEILTAAREDIQRIEYAYGDTSFALVRDSATWRLEPAGVSAEESAVTGILGQLANYRAIGFAADSVLGTLDWNAATARVTVLGPGGVELARLSFIEREDPGYYVRRGASDVVYTVSSFAGEQVLKREGDLRISGPESAGETSG